jgi:hypothetical protein
MAKFLDWLLNSRDASFFFIGYLLNELFTQILLGNTLQVILCLFLVVTGIYYIPDKE